MELKEAGHVVPNDMVCFSLVFLSYSFFTRKGQSSKTRQLCAINIIITMNLGIREPKSREVSQGKSGTQNLPAWEQLGGSARMTP